MSRLLWCFTVFLWLVSICEEASAQSQFQFPITWGERALAHGNGNKVVIGRFNTLHAVYVHNAYIRYSTSIDGNYWTTSASVNASSDYPNTLPSSQPAIAVDGAGSLGVVWVAEPSGTGQGVLYYAYKSAAGSTWTRVSLGVTGREPAIIGSGSSMYLTWTEISKVRFAKLTTLSPPATLAAETIEQTGCSGTGFRKPAITLIKDPCRPPIARVAYLYYRDEQSTNPFSRCYDAVASVGPRVLERNNTTAAWSLVYQDVIGSSVPTSFVEPISLSASSDFSSGRTFVAWSDSINGSPRSKIANRQPGGWYVAPLANERRHVHVRAGGSMTVPATEFRLAWTSAGTGIDEFFNPQSQRATGTWTGAAPVLTSVPLFSGFATGRPQGFRWRRCASGTYTSIDAYFEAEGPCGEAFVGTDLSSVSPCPVLGVVFGVASPCHEFVAYMATVGNGIGGPKTAVDVEDIGAIVEVGATYARVRTPDQRTALITWSSGTVVASSDTTITVSAPRSEVAVRGDSFPITIVESGQLAMYESISAPPRMQCLQ